MRHFPNLILKPKTALNTMFHIVVFVDGVEQEHVFEVDTGKSFIRKFSVQKNGRALMHSNGTPHTEHAIGFVELEFYYNGQNLTERLFDGL